MRPTFESGTRYFKDREAWPLEKRLEILDDLISIPAKFDVPVAFGAIDWKNVTPDLLTKPTIFRNPAAVMQLGLELTGDYYPFRKIKDTVHFAKKEECRHLQLADACAFVMRQHYMRNERSDRFWNVLKPLLIWHPVESSVDP
jgi:hypothetical protein